MSDPNKKIAVLGAGSWGTALAALVARHGYATMLWGRDVQVIDSIDVQHQNFRYLPDIALPHTLRASTDLA
ncbi:MAG TPA: NAD(P)H-dependent glycerol-3-phosphate dehydrogenase, partial [Xylella sp.]